LAEAGFVAIDVCTVVQQIAFPSVLDYVRFQLLATPMSVLLKDRAEADRQAAISLIASETADLSAATMLHEGKFSFPQEGYVATARNDD
jgi:hypothetical protein